MTLEPEPNDKQDLVASIHPLDCRAQGSLGFGPMPEASV
eukprot:CAMPEP_0114537284 /NCGR_PEP_ID=MMETSP0109-20121206/29495_1 /TAXON_ID=29199 /ORGANISM="Chlorarachnion reptans, Strain CCCM449" /LENGTH=38 /DNA_ID= /DNA_START= /DNA_END= /DNA_ORIENTATION=